MVERFRVLGRAMAKALQDSRLLDLPLSYLFYRCVLQQTQSAINAGCLHSSDVRDGGLEQAALTVLE